MMDCQIDLARIQVVMAYLVDQVASLVNFVVGLISQVTSLVDQMASWITQKVYLAINLVTKIGSVHSMETIMAMIVGVMKVVVIVLQ